jgi:hypothetical protein
VSGWRTPSRAGTKSGPREFKPSSIATAYDDAVAHLRGRAQINLPGKATVMQHYESAKRPFVVIVYHNTEIVMYNPYGRIFLNNGGHQTPTTAYKIAEYCPWVRIWRANKAWVIARRLGEGDERPTVAYVNGMVLYPDGTLAAPGESHLEAVARDAAPAPITPRPLRKAPERILCPQLLLVF